MWDNRLKITLEDYDLLKRNIWSVEAEVGHKAVEDYRRVVSYAKDQFTAFVWGMFGNFNRKDHWVFYKTLNKYIDDKHIETALKSILSAYKHDNKNYVKLIGDI